MKSPFPGMDPFLEPYWLSVHSRLVVYAADQLAESLPPDLCAITQERVLVEEDEHVRRSFYPDVYVSSSPTLGLEPSAVESTETALAEPVIIRMRDEPIRQSYIEIIDVSSGDKVVTVIEFVSPTNKQPGDGQAQYRRKQQECVDASVNLVEIDLTRGGQRRLLAYPDQVPVSHAATYQACVWRACEPTQHELFPISLRRPLPSFHVPLRPDDDDAVLRLQPLVDHVYAVGGYWRRINYGVLLDPPLGEDDQKWMEQLLAQRVKEER